MGICGIYKITSSAGRIYIGQSVDCLRRKYAYSRNECEVQRRLYRSILKHGWHNHIFEIIHECDKDELNTWEVHYIKLYDSFDTPHGLNLKSGGNFGGSPSKETRLKIGLSHKGNKHSLGKKHSAEAKKNHSRAVSGVNNPMYGKLTSAEVKKKISDKTKGIKKSEIARKNISNNHFRRPVNQIGFDGSIITTWTSAREAANNGFNFAAIHNSCKGIRKTHQGFKWNYA